MSYPSPTEKKEARINAIAIGCAIVIGVSIMAAMLFVMLSQPAGAYSAKFENNANNFVSKYNKDFLPWYGYLLCVCEEYGLSEKDVAIITGRIKYETMFGKYGTGKYYNYGGQRYAGKDFHYQNEFDGIDAIVSLHNRKYKMLSLEEQHRKWVGWWNQTYYKDLQRTIRILSSY